MSPERRLAALVANPCAECKKCEHGQDRKACHLAYAAKVSQLAAICDLHRCTPLTKETLELNGFRENDYGYYWERYNGALLDIHKDGTIYAVVEGFDEGYPETLCQLHSVADLENLLDLLGIDKQIKLPKPHDEA